MSEELQSLKKKIGPLPLWSWILIVGGTIGVFLLYRSHKAAAAGTTNPGAQVDPNNPLGLTYAQEQSDIAQGIDPTTGQSFAQEQAANNPGSTGSGGGSGGGDPGTTGTGTDPFQAIDPATGNTYASELAGGGLNDGQTPANTFAGEITDVADGIAGLKALEALFAPVPATHRDKRKAGTPKGTIPARSGAHKPPAKDGYTIRGLGHGRWEYVPHQPTGSRSTTHRTTTPAKKDHTPPAKHVVSGKKKRSTPVYSLTPPRHKPPKPSTRIRPGRGARLR